jgi:hypothetical protein
MNLEPDMGCLLSGARGAVGDAGIEALNDERENVTPQDMAATLFLLGQSDAVDLRYPGPVQIAAGCPYELPPAGLYGDKGGRGQGHCATAYFLAGQKR